MPDGKHTERVQRFRKSRRERGEREMNIWVSAPIGAAIDREIARGRYRSRQEAFTHALEAMFAEKDCNVVT
ncbi:hypothetical protein [Microvirga rosea]|uniref:hypothetical protein n=1 Tax=Microvirga rosea TaxID=2715425 RepID=UPI001D0BDEAB|nr:hypothetical protein [Microvirga rosea]MCB8823523.1 hypothetical protein [Microvirga rosea]